MRKFFSKEVRGEDGDVVQMVLIVAVFVIILVSLIGIVSQTISSSNHKEEMSPSKNYETQNIEWVDSLGRGLEKWSVTNPDKELPKTGDYVPYDTFKMETLKDLSLPDSVHTFVKVVDKDESKQSFIVCAYYSESDTPKLRDMNIYAFDSSTLVTKKEDRGICLL
jgi:hypothetical protein